MNRLMMFFVLHLMHWINDAVKSIWIKCMLLCAFLVVIMPSLQNALECTNSSITLQYPDLHLDLKEIFKSLKMQ